MKKMMMIALVAVPTVAMGADLGEVGDKIGSWADYLSLPAVMMVAGVLETIMRLVKTEKPKSIMRGVASILRGVGKLLDGAAGLVDKVVPDKTK